MTEAYGMAWALLVLCLGISTVWTFALNGQGRGPLDAATEALVVTVSAGDGKVKVFHDGQWSSICGHWWDNMDAQVICRMEGYWHTRGEAILRPADPNEVILLDKVNCTGTEDSIDQCSFQGWTQHLCDIHDVAAVNCDPSGSGTVKARLVDGYGPWEGRLEVESGGGGGGGGQWRPVCHHGFDDLDAQVVCRMLGLRSEGGKAHAEMKFPQSNLSPLIHQLDCTGQESSIAQCKGRRAGPGENCTNVGVECYNCGGVYNTPNGTIESEHYPLNYPANLNCLYLIQPANDKQLYKLEFSNFSTEACCDSLQVKVLTADGSQSLMSSGARAKFSGSQSPPTFLGKAFALSFLTDGSHSMQGFRASWSPARVQDVTSVTCEGGHFRVDIDLSFLKSLYPDSTPHTISLVDPNCTGTVVNRNGKEHLVIEAATDSCGSRYQLTNSTIIYQNFIVDRVYAQGSSLIVRQRRWTIPIYCHVERSHTFQMHYNPFNELRRKRKAEAKAIAHARDRREVRGSITTDADFPYKFSAFKDRTFTTLDTARPVIRHLGDDLNLRVEMTGGDLDLKLVLRNCSAYPHFRPKMVYNIIENGCAVDAQTQILHFRQHGTDFRLKAFEFAIPDEVHIVNLSCTVTVCPANENSAECTQQCVSSIPLVGKRHAAVSEPIINRVSHFGAFNVTFGPIVLEK